MIQVDKTLFYAINGTRSPFLDAVMPVASYPWLLWVLALAAVALWGVVIYRRNKNWRSFGPVLFGAVLMLATAGVNDVITRAVKYDVGRLRPHQHLPFVYFQKQGEWRQNSAAFTPVKPKSDSFISGHASHTMALAVTVATLCPPLSPIIYTLPLVVGYSRIYLGKHYPGDVVCGWFAGAVTALFTRRLTRRMRAKLGLPKGKAYPEGAIFRLFSVCRTKKDAGFE